MKKEPKAAQVKKALKDDWKWFSVILLAWFFLLLFSKLGWL